MKGGCHESDERGCQERGCDEGGSRAFISTHPLVHKHVKMSVGKWILESICPHKHVDSGRPIFF